MTSTAARLHGSGYTVIFFGGPSGAPVPITFAQMINETTPTLVGDGFHAIQPIDWSRPAEIMTAMAMGHGTIDIDLIENWSEQAWNRLGPALASLGGSARGGTANDTILDIVRAISDAPGGIYVTKLINTPFNSGERTVAPHRRAVHYMGAKIVTVMDGDQNIDITTMEQTKRITFAYTHRIFQRNRVGSPATDTLQPQNLTNRAPQTERPI